jgi:tetratricopeptide (TPR) repeat protein
MGGTLPCPPDEELRQFLLGQLSETEAEGLERHLARCPRCVSNLDTLRPRDRLLDVVSAVAGSATAPPEEEVDEALLGTLYRLRRPDTASVADTPPPPHDTAEAYDFLAPPGEPDEVGRFGAYGILRELGSGGMGVVFAARQQRPRRVVALKMILAGRVGGQRLARFRGETEIVARLQHPNIVPIHEVGEHDGRPYFTMEHAAGGSLAQKLAAAPLAPRAAAELTEVLARAVHFAHEQGVVHRDLKPSNVLLSAGGVPKVADFGLAKQFDEDPDGATPGYRTESGALLGTPAYMAPEQASGDPRAVGRAADVYALGAILYECLTGRPPFKAAGVLETLEQVRSREPVPPSRLQPGVPRDLQTVCLKCLEKDPARRYASARDLADDLGRFLRGEPVRARPASPGLRLAKWVGRQPALAALAAVSGLSLVALLGGGLVYQSWLRAAVRQAEAEKAATRRQYRQANDTLNRMLGRLEGGRLAEVPRLKELQRDLLEDALAFYLSTLDGPDSPDPAVRRDTALACRRAADIQFTLGRRDAAGENYRRAIRLADGLPDAFRQAPENQALLIDCYHGLGFLAKDTGRLAEAEQQQRTALDLAEGLARARPEDPRWQHQLAQSEHDLAVVYQVGKSKAQAEAHYARAVDLLTGLVCAHPGEASYQSQLADSWTDLALVYRQTRRPAEATRAHAEATALLRPLIDGHPERVHEALSLATLYSNRAEYLRLTGHPQDAVDPLNQAVELTERVLRLEPQHAEARWAGWSAHGARAQLREALGRPAEAVQDWDRVVALDDQPNPWVRRVLRAVVLAKAGEHARAASEAEALAADPAVSADGLHDLAVAYALAVEAVRSDARLASAERVTAAERYAARAVALLRKLRGQGYFKDPARAQALRTDPDLGPLHDRDDFRKLLTDGEGGGGS